jgi:hypothetical protein
MTRSYMPAKYEPDPDEILAAVEAALGGNSRLAELLEEVARKVVVQDHLDRETSLTLAAEALQGCQRHLRTCANTSIPRCSRTAGYRASPSASVRANVIGAGCSIRWQRLRPVDAGGEL